MDDDYAFRPAVSDPDAPAPLAKRDVDRVARRDFLRQTARAAKKAGVSPTEFRKDPKKHRKTP